MKKLILISGPSCVGKGPLISAYQFFNKNIKLKQIDVIKSKESRNNIPRPNEVAFWDDKEFFQTRDELFSLKNNPDYFIGDCRGEPQAINILRLSNLFLETDIVLIEVFHGIGVTFTKAMKEGKIKIAADIKVISIFVSPLPVSETLSFSGLDNLQNENLVLLMKNKQLLRALSQQTLHSKKFEEMIQSRARSAVDEILSAKNYDRIIYLSDGEGECNWNMDNNSQFSAPPIGGALDALISLEKILNHEIK